MNTTPRARYDDLYDEIEDQLGRIAVLLENHGTTDRATWEHVGDLGHVKEQLKDVASFLNSEE